jgi:hypothetical protein
MVVSARQSSDSRPNCTARDKNVDICNDFWQLVYEFEFRCGFRKKLKQHIDGVIPHMI